MNAPLNVGLIAAVAAACFGASNVIAQRKASQAPAETAMRLTLLLHLATQPLWWISIVADLGGYGFQAWALAIGQVAFVQPILVLSLPISLVIGHLVGSHRLRTREMLWSVAFVFALCVFLIVGDPTAGVSGRRWQAWLVPLAVVLGATSAATIAAMRGGPMKRAVMLGVGAGMLFGVASVLTKSVTAQLGANALQVFAHWELWMLLVVGFAALLLLSSAYQAGDLRSALPAVSLGEPIIGVLLGIMLFHERLRINGKVAGFMVVASVVVMVIATVQLARSSATGSSAHEASLTNLPRR